MRTYIIKGIEHPVYESLEEVPKGLKYTKDWRNADVGDWVLAEDGCVIQILRKGYMWKNKGHTVRRTYVGTCTGSFVCTKGMEMNAKKHRNIYNFSSCLEGEEESIHPLRIANDTVTKSEAAFAAFVSSGMDLTEAYLKAFNAKSRGYADIRSAMLIRKERIRKIMKEELKPVMKSLGIDPELVLAGIRDIALNPETKDSDKLKALFELGDILDLKETQRTTEVSGALFQGFQPQQLENVDRPKLKEAKNA